MTNTDDVQRYADTIMAMIKEDQVSGQVPGDVSSLDELDESVDANDYFRQAQIPSGTDEAVALRNAVNDEVGRRLAGSQGGSWGVTWEPPEGFTLDIGRTTGYATRTEAEAVGQQYLTEHSGAYHVHGG
jgi:hypothetical protein